ncbi:MAG: thermonuclease family protein [Deltaproteobacteria bacterium]|nr:thermonuclease family protein [Deltaproteobacteria bacterium]
MGRRIEISPNLAYWTVVVLLCVCSVFFAVNVELRRQKWSLDINLVIESGGKVEVLKVIDGDEVSVKHSSGTFVVRLLGIKGFNPKANEPGLSGLGAQAAQAMTRVLSSSKEKSVHFETFKKDRAGRLLAYIQVGKADLGKLLVRDGFVVAYTRYPFGKENAYLAAELEAQTRKKGLWANEKAVSRVQGWKGSWEAQRHDQ